MSFEIEEVDNSDEKTILAAMLISEEFIRKINGLVKPEYFKSTNAKKLLTLINKHYTRFSMCIGTTIFDMIESEKQFMPEDAYVNFERFVVSIAERASMFEDGLNLEYLVDKTERFVRTRETELTVAAVQNHLAHNRLEEAELGLMEFKKVSGVLSNTWVNPSNEDFIHSVFEERGDSLIDIPGDLGRFLGPLKRRWFIGISAPFKVGKSFFVNEFAVMATLSKRKVVIAQLEMSEPEQGDRLFKRFTGLGHPEGGRILYPCFDCRKNQKGVCNKRERTNHVKLEVQDGNPRFDLNGRYRPCDWCRTGSPFEFEPTTWLLPVQKQPYDLSNVGKSIKPFRRLLDRGLRIKAYPRFAANLSNLRNDLDILESTEGFVPDVVIVDYVDILAPERKNLVGVEKEDESWKALGALAAERNALVITPTQITREGLSAKSVKSKHMARWIGKLGHVDMMLTLNQTPKEKRKGILRVGMIAHRHSSFDEEANCVVLSDLGTGQTHLDSYYNPNKTVIDI